MPAIPHLKTMWRKWFTLYFSFEVSHLWQTSQERSLLSQACLKTGYSHLRLNGTGVSRHRFVLKHSSKKLALSYQVDTWLIYYHFVLHFYLTVCFQHYRPICSKVLLLSSVSKSEILTSSKYILALSTTKLEKSFDDSHGPTKIPKWKTTAA